MAWRAKQGGWLFKVALWGCESGTSELRKWHIGTAKVAHRNCESGTSELRKWHIVGLEVPLLELSSKLTLNQNISRNEK